MKTGLIAELRGFGTGAVTVALTQGAIGEIPPITGTLEVGRLFQNIGHGTGVTARHARTGASIRSIVTPSARRILLNESLVVDNFFFVDFILTKSPFFCQNYAFLRSKFQYS